MLTWIINHWMTSEVPNDCGRKRDRTLATDGMKEDYSPHNWLHSIVNYTSSWKKKWHWNSQPERKNSIISPFTGITFWRKGLRRKKISWTIMGNLPNLFSKIYNFHQLPFSITNQLLIFFPINNNQWCNPPLRFSKSALL